MRNYHADYHELFRRDDVDAVLIALPIPLLYESTRAALEAGKHVLCEKPTGSNMDEARAFLALSDTYSNQKVLIGENFFYRDDLRLARSLIDQGRIGTPHMLAYRVVMQHKPREGQYTSTEWRIHAEYRGGPFLDASVHDIAELRMLCGEVDEVHAFLANANPTMAGPSDMVLNMRFRTGIVGTYSGGFLPIATPDERNELRLYGSEGLLAISVRAPRYVKLYGADGKETAFTPETDGGYVNQLLNFYDAIVFDEPIVGTIAQSVLNMAVVMRAIDSAESGQPVRIAETAGAPEGDGVPLWRRRGADPLFAGAG
jgi:predicted dehydrogenase